MNISNLIIDALLKEAQAKEAKFRPRKFETALKKAEVPPITAINRVLSVLEVDKSATEFQVRGRPRWL